MKTLKQLNEELKAELAIKKIEAEKREYIKRSRNVQSQLNRIRHPTFNAAYKLKGHLATSIPKVATYLRQNAKNKETTISPSKFKTKTKTRYIKKLVKNKKGHYVPKYIPKKVKVRIKSHQNIHKSNDRIADPYGLNNIWRIPHI